MGKYGADGQVWRICGTRRRSSSWSRGRWPPSPLQGRRNQSIRRHLVAGSWRWPSPRHVGRRRPLPLTPSPKEGGGTRIHPNVPAAGSRSGSPPRAGEGLGERAPLSPNLLITGYWQVEHVEHVRSASAGDMDRAVRLWGCVGWTATDIGSSRVQCGSVVFNKQRLNTTESVEHDWIDWAG